MRYLGKISDPKDLVTKEYVDSSSSGGSAIAGLSAGFVKSDGNGGLASVATIGTANIANKAVTTEKIAEGAVTWDKIADGEITTQKIAEGTVTANKLANNIPYTKFGLSAEQVRGIYIGTETPSNTLGNNGDIYIKYNA